ncbi:MAG: MBOAT family protein [Lachnospiraceae bacterium]|nr:MBOAT family protein [Lachnospiraceae bacterium]
MLFNSYIFIFLFLPLTLLGYFTLNRFRQYRVALLFLVSMSFWFYGYNNINYLFILSISIIINYLLGSAMLKLSCSLFKRISFLFAIAFNLGILFYFKYYDFFINNINSVLDANFPILRIALPLGISFYTFQQVSFVIDCYKSDCEKYSLLEYAAYVSFFSQLIAGPIVYHEELIPQFRNISKRKICFTNLSKGLYAFALGLAKKVLLADTLSQIVVLGYSDINSLNSVSALIVMICYSLQIYFDFSGYCDMAYGIGYMMNIELPQNFNSPYKSQSVSEFWERWHMTLTRFFTRYIYIPLGGNRRGQIRTNINIFIVFFISGIWHGANWTFILWGIIHGLMTIISKFRIKHRLSTPKIFKQLITFALVTLSWSIFRASSISEAFLLIKQLFTGGLGPIHTSLISYFEKLVETNILYHIGLGSIFTNLPWLPLTLFIVTVLCCCFVLKNTQEKVSVMKFTNRTIISIVLLLVWSILSLSGISEFIYFNF